MTIKILCACGTKFAFDVEPIGGKMPAAVACPSCSIDATEAANEIIAQQLGMMPPAQEAAAAPVSIRVGLTAPGTAAVKVAAAAPAPDIAGEPVGEMCARHATSPAAANCVVCHKPICLDCMTVFGYLCSAYCKGLAARKNISVPRYEGMRSELIESETKKGNKFLFAAAAVLFLCVGIFAWYSFIGSKPKMAWNLQASPAAALG